jgi:hypothetical protein
MADKADMVGMHNGVLFHIRVFGRIKRYAAIICAAIKQMTRNKLRVIGITAY